MIVFCKLRSFEDDSPEVKEPRRRSGWRPASSSAIQHLKRVFFFNWRRKPRQGVAPRCRAKPSIPEQSENEEALLLKRQKSLLQTQKESVRGAQGIKDTRLRQESLSLLPETRKGVILATDWVIATSVPVVFRIANTDKAKSQDCH